MIKKGLMFFMFLFVAFFSLSQTVLAQEAFGATVIQHNDEIVEGFGENRGFDNRPTLEDHPNVSAKVIFLHDLFVENGVEEEELINDQWFLHEETGFNLYFGDNDFKLVGTNRIVADLDDTEVFDETTAGNMSFGIDFNDKKTILGVNVDFKISSLTSSARFPEALNYSLNNNKGDVFLRDRYRSQAFFYKEGDGYANALSSPLLKQTEELYFSPTFITRSYSTTLPSIIKNLTIYFVDDPSESFPIDTNFLDFDGSFRESKQNGETLLLNEYLESIGSDHRISEIVSFKEDSNYDFEEGFSDEDGNIRVFDKFLGGYYTENPEDTNYETTLSGFPLKYVEVKSDLGIEVNSPRVINENIIGDQEPFNTFRNEYSGGVLGPLVRIRNDGFLFEDEEYEKTKIKIIYEGRKTGNVIEQSQSFDIQELPFERSFSFSGIINNEVPENSYKYTIYLVLDEEEIEIQNGIYQTLSPRGLLEDVEDHFSFNDFYTGEFEGFVSESSGGETLLVNFKTDNESEINVFYENGTETITVESYILDMINGAPDNYGSPLVIENAKSGLYSGYAQSAESGRVEFESLGIIDDEFFLFDYDISSRNFFEGESIRFGMNQKFGEDLTGFFDFRIEGISANYPNEEISLNLSRVGTNTFEIEQVLDNQLRSGNDRTQYRFETQESVFATQRPTFSENITNFFDFLPEFFAGIFVSVLFIAILTIFLYLQEAKVQIIVVSVLLSIAMLFYLGFIPAWFILLVLITMASFAYLKFIK